MQLQHQSDNMEKFNLTWQSHPSTSSKLLFNLLRDNELTDVTIVSGDMKEFKAHKVILGAVSSVFKELFTGKSDNHFCIYLGDTKDEDVQAMLEFIYTGEATVGQSNIDSFFNIAKLLKLRD